MADTQTQSKTGPWPKELRLQKDRAALSVGFESGETFTLSAEYLRVSSPSAEVKGHGPNERRVVAHKRDVKITAVEPVGNYAVRLLFNDGHATGIYSWTYLWELGRDERQNWRTYLDELSEKGLSRDPPKRR